MQMDGSVQFSVLSLMATAGALKLMENMLPIPYITDQINCIPTVINIEVSITTP